MRIETTTRELFTFDELNEKAQETALDACRDWNVDDCYWQDFTINDIKAAGERIGIDAEKVYFSGFWSQGNGACFVGRYSYAKQAVRAIVRDYPTDERLARIAARLQTIQAANFYQLSATVEHSGYYYHSGCTTIEVFRSDGDYAAADIADEVKAALRDFMDWAYAALEKEYEYLTGDDAVRDTIRANEIEFLIDGRPA